VHLEYKENLDPKAQSVTQDQSRQLMDPPVPQGHSATLDRKDLVDHLVQTATVQLKAMLGSLVML
jgi:hypothetical protein